MWLPYMKATTQSKKFVPSGRRLLFLSGVATYMSLFTFSYFYFISPSFYYIGFISKPQSVGMLLLIYGSAILPAVWMPIRIRRPSQVIYTFLYAVVFIPSVLILGLASTLPTYQALGVITLLLSVMALTQITYYLPLLRVRPLTKKENTSIAIISSIGLFLYAIIFAQYGINLDIPSLSDVYSQRAEFRAQVSGFGAYAFFWLAKAFNPFLIAKGYLEKNKTALTLGVAGQVLLFSMSGLKSVLFSFMLLAGVFIALHKRGKHFGSWVVWGLATLIILTSAVDYYFGISVASSLFVRRFLMVPGLNTGYFFDFFSQNPHAFLGHSVFAPVVDYPYESVPALVVGEAYYGHLNWTLDTSANVNLWADGYANFGVFGVFLFTFALITVLWAADSLSNRKDMMLSVLMLAYPAYALVNTKLQTSMLTHGIIIVLIILYLIPSKN